MIAAFIVSAASMVALAILGIAFLVTVYRVVAGPTLPDRVLGLDMLVAVAIGFIAVIAIKTGFTLYIDIAISLGLVGFLATIAFARFVLTHGEDGRSEKRPSTAVEAGAKAKRPKGKRVGKDARQRKGGR
ncbi:MAG: cation:proton antiporter [Rhizobiaceae bacterium]|nr:cation:proton antiporter [Rhizobiaceae bacterium]